MTEVIYKARYPAIVVALIAIIVLIVTSASFEPTNVTASAATVAEPTPSDLEVALLRAGLGPEALTAAGASASDATTLVIAAHAYMTVNPGVLDATDAAFALARLDVDQLTRMIRSGQGAAEDVQDLGTAQAAMATADAQRDGILDAVVTAGAALFSPGEQQTLATVKANSSWDLPIEFLVVNRTEPDWVQLRECLANERIAAAEGEAADPDCQTTLTQLRGDPAVITATNNLTMNLAAVTAAWRDAIYPE